MSKNNDPIYYSHVECPVCGTMNEYENIRSGSYTEAGRDTDFRPIGIVWNDPAYQKYNPLLFFVATCKKCFYSREIDNEFKNWQKDSSFKTYRLKHIQEKHIQELNGGTVIRSLGTKIDRDKYPFETAIIKLLLAVYDEKLTARPSNLNQGRYWLRVAWLFRSRKNAGSAEQDSAAAYMNRLNSEAMMADKALAGYELQIDSLRSTINSNFSDYFAEDKNPAQYKKQIEARLDEIATHIEQAKIANTNLAADMVESEKNLLSERISGDELFYDYPNLSVFLETIKGHWSEIPLNERGALVNAAEAYTQAYEVGKSIAAGVQQIQAAYMIAEISQRAGNHKIADQYFNQMIRLGRELVLHKKADKSSISFTNKLLEMGMDQARQNRKMLQEVG